MQNGLQKTIKRGLRKKKTMTECEYSRDEIHGNIGLCILEHKMYLKQLNSYFHGFHLFQQIPTKNGTNKLIVRPQN